MKLQSGAWHWRQSLFIVAFALNLRKIHSGATQSSPVLQPTTSFHAKNDECSICLESFEKDRSNTWVCANGHVHHIKCLQEQLEHRMNVCPLCRAPLILWNSWLKLQQRLHSSMEYANSTFEENRELLLEIRRLEQVFQRQSLRQTYQFNQELPTLFAHDRAIQQTLQNQICAQVQLSLRKLSGESSLFRQLGKDESNIEYPYHAYDALHARLWKDLQDARWIVIRIHGTIVLVDDFFDNRKCAEDWEGLQTQLALWTDDSYRVLYRILAKQVHEQNAQVIQCLKGATKLKKKMEHTFSSTTLVSMYRLKVEQCKKADEYLQMHCDQMKKLRKKEWFAHSFSFLHSKHGDASLLRKKENICKQVYRSVDRTQLEKHARRVNNWLHQL